MSKTLVGDCVPVASSRLWRVRVLFCLIRSSLRACIISVRWAFTPGGGGPAGTGSTVGDSRRVLMGGLQTKSSPRRGVRTHLKASADGGVIGPTWWQGPSQWQGGQCQRKNGPSEFKGAGAPAHPAFSASQDRALKARVARSCSSPKKLSVSTSSLARRLASDSGSAIIFCQSGPSSSARPLARRSLKTYGRLVEGP